MIALLAFPLAACGPPDLPGPVRGTWSVTETETGRKVTVEDTLLRLEVAPEALGGSAVLRFDAPRFRRSADHLRVTFDELTRTQFLRDSVVSRMVLSRDSVVVERGDERLVTTSPDSVLPGRGRLVLVPHADSSLVLGLPGGLFQAGGAEALEQMTSVAWPASADRLDGMEGWSTIRYRSYVGDGK